MTDFVIDASAVVELFVGPRRIGSSDTATRRTAADLRRRLGRAHGHDAEVIVYPRS